MTMKFHVPDMSCGHCKATIEKAITGADPLAEISFDMEGRHIEVGTELKEEAVTKLLEEAGYAASAV